MSSALIDGKVSRKKDPLVLFLEDLLPSPAIDVGRGDVDALGLGRLHKPLFVVDPRAARPP